MRDPNAEPPAEVDFDAVYRGDPFVEGSAFHFERAPWDLGEPQPVLVELEAAGAFAGRILDVGCGPGEHTIFLAERGYQVTGVDSSSTALHQARQRARERGVDVDFFVDDATELNCLRQRFDMVLDSALYHCLAVEQRADYAAALHRVTVPGACLRLLCFADAAPGAVPIAVSEQDVRRNLGEYWNITELERTSYVSSVTKPQLIETMRSSGEDEPAAGMGIDPDEVATDERGRLVMPVWDVRAQRR